MYVFHIHKDVQCVDYRVVCLYRYTYTCRIPWSDHNRYSTTAIDIACTLRASDYGAIDIATHLRANDMMRSRSP